MDAKERSIEQVSQGVRSSVDGDGDVLIVTAVEAERDALLRGLRDGSPFDVVAGGVGPTYGLKL